MSEPSILIPYSPRRYQWAMHNSQARFRALVAHRRAGKTVSLVNELIRAALQIEGHPGRLAYIAPTYRMAKRIAWDYVKHFSASVPGAKGNSSELRMDYPNGARVSLYGADAIHDLRGIYLDGAVLDEYAMMSPRLFPEVVLPALMDWHGWAVVAGTPLGANQLKSAYQNAADGAAEWAAFMWRASETKAIADADLATARANMTDAEYAQEFECSFDAVIKGAYFGKEIAAAESTGRVCDVPYNPGLGVTVAVDLGMRDAFACWFLQEHFTGGQVRAIDYREWHGLGLPQIKREIDALGYTVTRWIAPHDIEVRELGTGRSRLEISRELGMDWDKASAMKLEDGIEATRAVIPLLVFDRKKCALGIDALRQYRSEWDEKRQIQNAAPLHDWTSHCADALRTYATARSGALRTDWRESLRDIGTKDRTGLAQAGIGRRVANRR